MIAYAFLSCYEVITSATTLSLSKLLLLARSVICLSVRRKGEVACCEEIKAFAVKHNIKQQQIAVLAGT